MLDWISHPSAQRTRAYPVNTQFTNGGLFAGQKWGSAHDYGLTYDLAASRCLGIGPEVGGFTC
jgi:hypothetical protein